MLPSMYCAETAPPFVVLASLLARFNAPRGAQIDSRRREIRYDSFVTHIPTTHNSRSFPHAPTNR